MKIIDVLGKPCPIPVVEARKALALSEVEGVLVKVDNTVAVQNLRKMADSFGYSFSCEDKGDGSYEVAVNKDGKAAISISEETPLDGESGERRGPTVVISRNTMGEGAEELGKILIKGFIYSLTELSPPPEHVIFLNSGAYLTSEGANTVDDLRRLAEKGTGIFTCGTCVNYYGLQGRLAAGEITDMYGITQKMASASRLINI